MSILTCCVPMPETLKNHALLHKPDALIYKYICGRPAKWQVGMWEMCDKHKEFMADPSGWHAELIKQEDNNETIKGGC